MLERDSLVTAPAVGISRLKILLVTQAFPPFNTSGAVRLGKLASYLIGRGHDVRVLTASPLPYPRTLKVEIPFELVIQTRSVDPLELLSRRRRHTATGGGTPGPALLANSRTRVRRWVGAVFGIPDPQAAWYPYAVARGRRLLRSWHPDIVYASALPFTAHLVAARLARLAGIPWVAEFRDHFYGNPVLQPAFVARSHRSSDREKGRVVRRGVRHSLGLDGPDAAGASRQADGSGAQRV